MGNCSHRAVSDGGSVTVIKKDSKDVEIYRKGGKMKDEYYRSRSCSSLLQTREKAVGGYLVREGIGPKIQVSPQRRNGVWKAKVVIGSKQLEEILAVEGNTHALIDQLRFAAAAASTTSSEMVGVSDRTRKNNDNYLC